MMSERVNILVSMKDVFEKYGRDGKISKRIPTLGEIFAENADMHLVGKDSKWSARYSVPADKKDEIMEAVREKGYIAEDDYAMKVFSDEVSREPLSLLEKSVAASGDYKEPPVLVGSPEMKDVVFTPSLRKAS